MLLLALVAAAMRLWELDQRVMHYDESLHLFFGWEIARSLDFAHQPWLHGPLQFQMVAAVLWLLGETTFLARLPYALFGVALVVLPWFLRRELGNKGTLCAAVLLAFSPSLLYFARMGRNDILMAVWTLSLLVLLWRYNVASRRRYLLGAAAITALMLATKETSYFTILLLGLTALGLGWRQLQGFVQGRLRLRELDGAAGFLLFLGALTLPQAAAMAGALLQPLLGLSLVAVIDQIATGGPVWEAPFVTLPVWTAPAWLHTGAAAALTTILVLGAMRFHAGAGLGCRAVSLLIGAATLATLLWALVFGSGIQGIAALLPPALPAEQLAAGVISVNHLVASLILLLLLVAGAAVGIAWGGGLWLACAGIFYAIWIPLHTIFFANLSGIFTGAWQGLGYWLLQQDVHRGSQAWYYYGVGLTVYELPALCFGLAGIVWLARRRQPFGVVLAAWAAATLAFFSIATERMPWLLVNITAPLALVAGMRLGDLMDRLPLRRITWRSGTMFLLAPACVAAAALSVWLIDGGEAMRIGLGLAVLCALLLAASRLARYPRWHRLRTLADAKGFMRWRQAGSDPPAGRIADPANAGSPQPVDSARSDAGRAAALGIAALLLGLGATGAWRAAYTYDDSNKEMLVFAQGSANLVATFDKLRAEMQAGAGADGGVVVDWGLRFPFQWYIRRDWDFLFPVDWHSQRESKVGDVHFAWFCPSEETQVCRNVGDAQGARAYMTGDHHDMEVDGYTRGPPRRNLIWFPRSYQPLFRELAPEASNWEVFKADLAFLWDFLTDPAKWRAVIGYVVARRHEGPWFYSEFYLYEQERMPATLKSPAG